MNINETDDKKIVFNTPQNFNISEAFPEFSKKHLPKIEYLLNQINWCKDSRGYQINIDNHAWSLCLNNGEVIAIINKLVQLNIIRKASEHIEKKYSNGYSMVKPYTNETSTKTFYAVEDHLFLQKLKADKWVAKGKEHSSFVKQPGTIGKAKTKNTLALEQRVKQLEAFIADKGLLIPAYPELKHEEAPLLHDNNLPKPESLEVPLMTVVKPDPEKVDYTLGMTPLNSEISIHLSDDILMIEYIKELGSILNYDKMAGWFQQLNTSEKINLIEAIMTEPGQTVHYPVNPITYAIMNKWVEDDCVLVDYIDLKNSKAA